MLRQLLVLWAGIILSLIGGSSSFGQTDPSESQVVPDAGDTLGGSLPQAGPLILAICPAIGSSGVQLRTDSRVWPFGPVNDRSIVPLVPSHVRTFV